MPRVPYIEEEDHPELAPLVARIKAERAVLAYTDSMTKEIQVSDELFAEVRKHFDAQGLVELTATIAGYNLVSRFLEAMQVHHQS